MSSVRVPAPPFESLTPTLSFTGDLKHLNTVRYLVAHNSFHQLVDKSGCFVVGDVGAGKSTLIAVLCGCQIQFDDSDNHLFVMNSPFGIAAPRINNGVRPYQEAQAYSVLGHPELAMIDTSGVYTKDDRGPSISRRWIDFSLAMQFHLLKEIRAIVIVLDWQKFSQCRFHGLDQFMVHTLSPFFNENISFEDVLKSVVLVFTNAYTHKPRWKSLDAEAIRKRLSAEASMFESDLAMAREQRGGSSTQLEKHSSLMKALAQRPIVSFELPVEEEIAEATRSHVFDALRLAQPLKRHHLHWLAIAYDAPLFDMQKQLSLLAQSSAAFLEPVVRKKRPNADFARHALEQLVPIDFFCSDFNRGFVPSQFQAMNELQHLVQLFIDRKIFASAFGKQELDSVFLRFLQHWQLLRMVNEISLFEQSFHLERLRYECSCRTNECNRRKLRAEEELIRHRNNTEQIDQFHQIQFQLHAIIASSNHPFSLKSTKFLHDCLCSDPSKLPKLFLHALKSVTEFFNNKVLPSAELTNFFAIPFVVNTLTRMKLAGSLPPELHTISKILLRKTLAKFDEIEMNQEPASRAKILQEVLDERQSISQLAFQDLAIICHQKYATSLFNDFHKLYINFFNQKLQLEETESRHQNHLEELEQFHQLQHFELQHYTLTEVQDCQNEESDFWNFSFLEIVAQQYQLQTSCLEIVEHIGSEENTARNELSKEFRKTLQTLQAVNDRKTASLRRICMNHNIPLPESVIQKLTSENVMESGEFELLDSARLESGMNIGHEDRLKVLRLVKLHGTEEIVEMRSRYSELASQNQEMQRRLRLNNELGSLQQEKISLIMKLLDSQEKNKWLDSMNYSMNMNNATIDELQQAIDDLGNENADLAKIVGEQRSASSQQRQLLLPQHGFDTARSAAYDGDDQSAAQDTTASEQRYVDAVNEALVSQPRRAPSEHSSSQSQAVSETTRFS